MDYLIRSIIAEAQFEAILTTRQERPYNEVLINARRYSNKLSVLLWISSCSNLFISNKSEQIQIYL